MPTPFERRNLSAGPGRALRRRFAMVLFLVSLFTTGLAQAVSPDEVKAAYLFRFTSYVEWPPASFADAQAPIVIGVADAAGVLEHLTAQTRGKRVGTRPVLVRPVSRSDDLQGVHLVFLGGEAPPPTPAWLQRARSRSVLVVGEGARALGHGAALSLVQVNDRVRFEASLQAAAQSGVKLSSRLLAVADRVEPAQ